ncbi:hypothetical protein K504DRAFT_451037 [Pleomassaria siparia CBS 279.74]|uniref:Uncharacterized protein n=1 Tax=Pleomassaria siparia CBS 279.74 TaxID=1314801 RepID=A0A6G1JVG4_9PLEO|nr:hypothetical protein K504DRAFT_451037 [Pleomassaria siparia CBS 279.74]
MGCFSSKPSEESGRPNRVTANHQSLNAAAAVGYYGADPGVVHHDGGEHQQGRAHHVGGDDGAHHGGHQGGHHHGGDHGGDHGGGHHGGDHAGGGYSGGDGSDAI